VNNETVTLIRRPYQELVDDLLTSIVGGVVNEQIFFDVKSDLYPLAREAQGVRSITGTVDDRATTFQPLLDFVYSEGDKAVVWQDGGTRPDDETIFYVDYLPLDARSPLTDVNVGSVTRTLAEAIGREIAMLYGEVDHAYLGAFVDTAEGTALDFVVAILGVTRKRKDFAEGLVTFFRDPTVDGSITIAEGTVLATTDGAASFETTQWRTLQRGQVRIDVPVRATEASKGDAGRVPAGAITALSQPIAGIQRVTNLEPTALGAEDETDAELRERARAALRGIGKATLAALAHAVFANRAQLIEIRDPNGAAGKRSEPGTVSLLVATEPERFASLASALHETRAAGVEVTILARYVFFKPRLVATVTSGLTGAGKEKVVADAIAALQACVDGLGGGAPVKGDDVLGALKSVKDLSAPRFADVLAWRSDLGTASEEVLVDRLLAAIGVTPPADPAALADAIRRVLDENAPGVPGARRIPDRGLVVGPSGARATDAEIEAGAFEVRPVDETWWVALDVEPADIVLVEEGT